ncbi:AMP-binding protein [Streptomyces sp. NPDC053427]|uniref:AMP-binding protein n=1 Tax=Streptomyces sp. NPDC053427 TaxID=3365701 RepID=UPI0037D59871
MNLTRYAGSRPQPPAPTALTSNRDAYEAFLAARDTLLRRAAEGGPYPAPDLTAVHRAGEFNWARDWFDVIAHDNHTCALRVVALGPDGSRFVSQLSYAQLSDRSTLLAGALAARGVGQGDRLLLMTGNRTELWETMLAAFKIGAVVVPVSTQLGREDLHDRMHRAGVQHVIAESVYARRFPVLPALRNRIALDGGVLGWTPFAELRTDENLVAPRPAVHPDDPMLLYFTSGTTSLPKIVQHTHTSYPVGHLSTMYWLGLRPGDVHLNVSSPGWAKHAWSSLFAPWNAQATVVAVNQQRFTARGLLDTLSEQRATTLCAPPTVWRMLLQEDLGHWPVTLREAVSAGEPIDVDTVEQVRRAWGVTVRDGYGQTETTAQIGHPPGHPGRPGAMGVELPGYQVVLVDPVTGERQTAASAEGEICMDLAARPIGLMAGYADSSGRAVIPGDDGLYHTGDIAVRDAEGWFTYVGRADDVFKASDYRISPFELESALLEHPAVVEAAVVPSPDPLRLAVPKAYVELARGYRPDADTARELLAHARAHLAPYKRVRRLEFRTALPKTESGKIRRALLREEAAAGLPGNEEWREEQFAGSHRPAAGPPEHAGTVN